MSAASLVTPIPAISTEPPTAPTSAAAAPRASVRLACHPFLWLVAPMLLLVGARYVFAPTDVDYWWHVRTGQLIAETGALPRVDVFSFPSAGQPWVTHEWLTQLVFFLVEEHLGFVGNVAIWSLAGAGVWLAVYATARTRGLGEPAAIVLAMWGSAMAFSITAVRPQVLTALFLAITGLLVTRYKLGGRRALWALPALFAVWVNLHGGYVIGLVLLGLTLAGESVAHLLGRPAAPLRQLGTVTVLSAAATLLSPNGLEALWYPFTYTGTGNASMRFIAEWQSPDFHESGFVVFGASLLLATLLGIWQPASGRLGPTEALWALLFSFMALSSLRHIPLYAIVVMPLIGARLAHELPWLARPLRTWHRPWLVLVAWPLLAATAIALAVRAEGNVGAQLSRTPSAHEYPTGAVQYIREHRLTGRLFNEYQWGGYLIYQLLPDLPVFIDGRADVHGDAFMSRYVRVTRLQGDWRQTLEDYDVTLMLIQRDTPLDVVLAGDPRWQELYGGPVERLYARRDAPTAESGAAE